MGNPWMAPGTAPVFSPCGWGGGNPEGCGGVPYGQECPGGGYSVGFDSRSVVWNDTVTTEWMSGSAAEVGWGLLANHGGATATDCARWDRRDHQRSRRSVSNKRLSSSPRRTAGCSTAGTSVPESGSVQTEQGRERSPAALSGR